MWGWEGVFSVRELGGGLLEQESVFIFLSEKGAMLRVLTLLGFIIDLTPQVCKTVPAYWYKQAETEFPERFCGPRLPLEKAPEKRKPAPTIFLP